MNETFLIARERKTGKDVLLAGGDVPYREQILLYREFSGQTHETYSRVTLVQGHPLKKPLRFLTEGELRTRKDQHAAQVKAEEAKQRAAEAKKKSSTGKRKGKKAEAETPASAEGEQSEEAKTGETGSEASTE